MTSASSPTAEQLSARCGFTLLEMLIVLAILAAVAAWTWPSMRRQMIASELRDAGKQVRAELARARQRAVETGTIQQFRFQPGQRTFEISTAACASADDAMADTDAFTTDPSAVGGGLGLSGEGPRPLPADRHELPEGVHFLSPAMAMDSRPITTLDQGAGDSLDSPGDDSSALAADPAASTTMGQDDAIWSPPIVFYPNGRTADAQIGLANRAGASLEVALRGLTGVAKVSSLQYRTGSERR
jgi:prepilin-type N-terminal cleavage/methylation domain-containing protein